MTAQVEAATKGPHPPWQALDFRLLPWHFRLPPEVVILPGNWKAECIYSRSI